MGKRVIVDELEFDVQYGRLCAKSWHEETDKSLRILMIHGWMDNAGSFDNLVPLLQNTSNDDLYIVGLDLPGHGKSSQLPAGCAYSDLPFLTEIRRCLLELKWAKPLELIENCNDEQSAIDDKKFTIIGHSLGAGFGLWYANLFPNEVESVILLDFLMCPPFEIPALFKRTASAMDTFIKTTLTPTSSSILLDSKTNHQSNDKGSVVVSQEAAIVATISAHEKLGNLSREDASCLLKRSTIPVSNPPNSVLYSRDLRLLSMLHLRDNIGFNNLIFSQTKCSVVSILANSGFHSREKNSQTITSASEMLKKTCKSLDIHWVDGDHYTHMNNASSVAQIINKYLPTLK